MRRIISFICMIISIVSLFLILFLEDEIEVGHLITGIIATATFIRVWVTEEKAYRRIILYEIDELFHQELNGLYKNEPQVKKLVIKALANVTYNNNYMALNSIKKAEKLAQKREDKANVYMIKGYIYAERKEYERAERCFEDSCKLEPDNPYVYAYMAGMYTELGNKRKLKECIKNGEEKGGCYLLAFYTSLYYEEIGRYKESYEYAIKAKDMNESRAESLIQLISLSAKNKDKNSAEKWYKYYTDLIGEEDSEYREIIDNI